MLAIPSYYWRVLSLLIFLSCSPTLWAVSDRFESNRYHFDTASVPDWVVATELPPQQNGLSGQAIHYFLSEWQTHIGSSDKDTTEFTRIVYSPVTESGVQDAAEISIDYRPDFESLTIHHIRLQRDGQTFDRLQPEQVRLIQQERDIEKHMYNGEVSALTILDDVRVGDIIEYAYSVKGRNPVFSGKYFSSYSLGWKAAVDRVAVRIVAPKNRRLYSRGYNIEIEPQQSVQGDSRIYSWQVDNSQPFKSEGETPDWFFPYPWLQITEYKNWKEVSRWADDLYKQTQPLSQELQQKILSWQQNSKSDDDAIAQALEFVQDKVRYFGVELGQNSHMPSRPDDVFERRYGDCKDKAVLLAAILTQMGYKAYPALVSMKNNRAVADWLPSPGVFDHVIVNTLIKGKDHWIDATRSHQRGRLERRGQPDFGKALVVGKGSSKLVDMLFPENYLPSVVIEELFVVESYNQPVEFIVTSRYSHDEAEWKRQYFANERVTEIEDKYLNFYARIYPGIEAIASLQVNDDEANNLITVIERYRIPEYWERKEGRLYSSFYGSTIGEYTRLPRTINRKMPLSQNYPIQIQHSSILQYPEDIQFDDIDDEIVIEDSGMQFVVRSSYMNKRLRVDYIYTALADAVMPEEVKNHLAMRRKVNDSLHFSAWVAESGSQPQQAIYQPPQSIMNKVLSRMAIQRH
jgi:transglutaminase-like putative cysteine protease